jgi:hypothetical protein
MTTRQIPPRHEFRDNLGRAAKYVLKMPRSISGQRGHDAALAAAVALKKGFMLSDGEALRVLQEWNSSCSPPWNQEELRHKLKQAGLPHPRDSQRPPGWLLHSVVPRLRGIHRMTAVPAPSSPIPCEPQPIPKLDYDPIALETFASKCETAITPELLREVSFIDLPPETDREATARTFLETVFQTGDNVLLFDEFRSQGNQLYVVGTGCFRLGQEPDAEPKPSELRMIGGQGIWYLANPVDGEWRSNDNGKLSRRSHQNVTAWRHLILESDVAPAKQWLKALVQLPFPILAIYTSGGKSVHAVLRLNASSKAELDEAITALKPVVCPLGADLRAMTSVRLSRLPGALRCGTEDRTGDFIPYETPRLQRLLWLSDGGHEFKSIISHLRPF